LIQICFLALRPHGFDDARTSIEKNLDLQKLKNHQFADGATQLQGEEGNL